jgi:hypothetical protein
MADWEALKRTESLYQRSNELSNAIDHETEEMKNAVRTAQDGLSLIDRLSDQTLSHTEYLGREITEGRKIAKRHVSKMQHIKELESEINNRMIMPFLLTKPRIISSDLATYHELPEPVIDSPNLNMNMSSAVEQSVISSLQANSEYWDMIAAEFETFDEQFEKAFHVLKQTEKVLRDAVQKPPYREHVSSVKREKQEKEIS